MFFNLSTGWHLRKLHCEIRARPPFPMSLPELTPVNTTPLVVIENLLKSFGLKSVLKDINWQIPRGQISGLLGPNGAGKTTLFRLLMGLLKADSGTLRVDGCDCFIDRVMVKRLVGFLPDEPVFYSYLSGQEILELSAGMHDLDPVAAVNRLDTLVGRLGMQEAMGQYADDYSRGVQILFQRRSENRLSGWLGYTFTQARSRSHLITLPPPFSAFTMDSPYGPTVSDQPHTVNLFASYRLTPSIRISAKALYGSGFPVNRTV